MSIMDVCIDKLGSRRAAIEAITSLVKKGLVIHSGGRLWTRQQWEAIDAAVRPAPEPFGSPMPSGKRQQDIYDTLALLGEVPVTDLVETLADGAHAAEGSAVKTLRQAYQRAIAAMADADIIELIDGRARLVNTV